MQHTRKFFVFFSILSLIMSALPNGTARAGTQNLPESAYENTPIPASRQQAILTANRKPFSQKRESFTTQHNGLGYDLNTSGLQANKGGINWSIALSHIGREGRPTEVSPPEIIQTDTRLEYRRGKVIEWYRDTFLGVEQGFTISESFQGNGRLVLHLDLETNLQGTLEADERGLYFESTDGNTLRYNGLEAFDADGNTLDAAFNYTPSQIVIRVDDRDAVYPITIDPFIYLEQKAITPSGAAGDKFGVSVAISGDTALIGAYEDDTLFNINRGSVYVFTRSGGIWIQQAKLYASDGLSGDHFGASVALDGDTALIGAPQDEIGANSNQGSAYVFVRSGSTWSQQAKLTASDGAADDEFGTSVALDGNTALVGAYADEDYQGSAYVFVRSGTTWSQQQKLVASDGALNDYFGWSVALDGNYALIGARWDNSPNMNQGSAYVFVRSGSTWSQQKKLTASDGESDDQFGWSVALDGNTALIGADWDTVDGTILRGSAYIFTRSGTNWIQQAKLTAPDGEIGDQFGNSVAIYGDTALVGASMDRSAHLFTRNEETWSYWGKLTASDGMTADQFGNSVALSSDTVLVGAFMDNIGTSDDQGSVYFYYPHTDLGLSTTFNVSSAYPDDIVYLTTTLANFGLSYPALDLSVSASLPAGITPTFVTLTHGTYNHTSGVWEVGLLPPGASATLTITARVNPPPKNLTFTASLLGSDSNTANNTASASLQVLAYIANFQSQATYDGWVLESTETSSKGGSKNNTGKAFYVGDDANNRQYCAILSFDTSGLPDTAEITKITLKVKKAGLVGTNPFKSHKGLRVDISNPYFGTQPTLQTSDFQIKASKKLAGKFSNKAISGWYSADLSSTSGYINLIGLTQFRLRFYKDDNNDFGADYFKFYSGNAPATSRPQLIIEYFIP